MKTFTILVLVTILAGSAWAAVKTDATHPAALPRSVTSASNPTAPHLRKQPSGPKVLIPAFRRVRAFPCPPVGSGAYEGLAFDGDSALYQVESVVGGVATLNKYNIHSGALLTSYSVAVNGYVGGMTYQGGALWIGQWYSTGSSSYVNVINRVDTLGNVLRSFTLPSPITGNNVRGLGWNPAGNDLFVTGVNAAVNAGDFWEIDTLTGAIARTVPIGTVSNWPMSGLVRTRGDSVVIWISDDDVNQDLRTINVQGASATLDTIYDVRADFPLGQYPSGICYDGRYLYVGAELSDSIVVYDLMQFNHDIGVSAINSPIPHVGQNSAVTPQVVYTNVGNNTETSITVGCFVDSSGTIVYRDSSVIASMAANAVDTISFAHWNTGPGGVHYTFTSWCRLTGDGDPANDTLRQSVVTVLPYQGPDGYGYYAYDNTDVGYLNHPVYNWIELNPARGGNGTSVGPGGDDQTYQQAMTGVGVKHYGANFTNASICTNGWMSMGTTTSTYFFDYALPSVNFVPDGIAPFWDDLNSTSAGTWWYLADTTNHRFVVEWDSIPQYRNLADRETFEVIVNDTLLTPPTALTHDSEIILQWNVVGDISSMTVGQQDASMSVGLNSYSDGTYDPAMAPIVAGRALKFTTDAPRLVGVELNPVTTQLPMHFALGLAAPNPSGGRLGISYDLPVAAQVSLKVYNMTGQVVKTLTSAKETPGYKHVQWDGRSDAGIRVASGVYFYRLQAGSFTATKKLVIAR
jgi:hypothetical protein